jgi:hypothetical protein
MHIIPDMYREPLKIIYQGYKRKNEFIPVQHHRAVFLDEDGSSFFAIFPGLGRSSWVP